MSHFTTINTEVRDIDALRDACKELGLKLEEHTTARPEKYACCGSASTSNRGR